MVIRTLFQALRAGRAGMMLALLSGPVAATSALEANGKVVIDYAATRQRIDGFGASSAWGSTWTAGEADRLFSIREGGAGLSLLRTRIAPDGTTVEAGLMKMAQERGARVWSTPWSPPAAMKDHHSVNGGNFVATPENLRRYAEQLAGYVGTMKRDHGIVIEALSVQNEPDLATDYESCVWTGQQIHDFVPVLAAALAGRGAASTKILLPESQHWQFDLARETMSDPKTAALVGILGGHNYGSQPKPVTEFGPLGAVALWETEHYFGKGDGMANGLEVAREIHDFLTVAEVNAYHYWWIKGSGNGSIMGDDPGHPAKRLFVMGQFSRFVRPGYFRIETANDTSALISAYRDGDSRRVVIVAVNPTDHDLRPTVILEHGPAVKALDHWVTTAALSLKRQPAVEAKDGRFTVDLPALSVVTFVGESKDAPPDD